MSDKTFEKNNPAEESTSELWERYSDVFESEEAFQKALAKWPVCPECGHRRAVRCPICNRPSDLCAQADSDFWDGVDETPGRMPNNQPTPAPSHECCGNCSVQVDKSSQAPTPKISVAEQMGLAAIDGTMPGGMGTGSLPEPGEIPAVEGIAARQQESGKTNIASLMLNDGDLYSPVHDWTSPRWNFNDQPRQNQTGQAKMDTGNDSPFGQYGFNEKSVWEVPQPAPEPSQGTGGMTASAESLGAEHTEKSFTVSTPNVHRSQMETLDMVQSVTDAGLSVGEDADPNGGTFQKKQSLLLCPSCDEPFVARFLPICKGCGHVFEDADSAALEAEAERYDMEDDLANANISKSRIMAMVIGILLLAAIAVAYVTFCLN